MDVRIGVIHAKELFLEMDGPPDEVESTVQQALDGGASHLWVTDRRGHRYCIPLDKLAYVEIESVEGKHTVGFGSS
jgi:hypothetical protein